MHITISFLNKLRNNYNANKDWFKRTFKRYELNAGHFSHFINSLENAATDRELSAAEMVGLFNILLAATSLRIESTTRVDIFSPEGQLFDDLKWKIYSLYGSSFNSIFHDLEALKLANLLTENNFTALVTGQNQNWVYRLLSSNPHHANMLTQNNFDAIIKLSSAGMKLLWILSDARILNARLAALCEIDTYARTHINFTQILEDAAESKILNLVNFDILNQNRNYTCQAANLAGYYALTKRGPKLIYCRKSPRDCSLNEFYLYPAVNDVAYSLQTVHRYTIFNKITLALGEDLAPIKASLQQDSPNLNHAQKEKIRRIAAYHGDYLPNGLSAEIFNLVYIKLPKLVKDELSTWLIDKADYKLTQKMKEKGFASLAYEERIKPQQAIEAKILEELLKHFHPESVDDANQKIKLECQKFIHDVIKIVSLDAAFFAKVTRETREYTQEELGRKKDYSICLVSIFGKVYDVAKYLPKHPGGENILLNAAGDIIDDVFSDGNHRHLKNKVATLLAEYQVGNLKK